MNEDTNKTTALGAAGLVLALIVVFILRCLVQVFLAEVAKGLGAELPRFLGGGDKED